MKKILIAVLGFLAVGLTARAQAPTIKKGTKLVYHVTTADKEYDYTITITKPAPAISFDWVMSDPVNTSGSISLTAGALATATAYKNYFEDDSKVTLSKESTVWLSKKNFNELKAKGKTRMDMTGTVYLYEREAKPMQISYLTKSGAKTSNVYACVFIKTVDTQYTIHVFDDAKNPLIQFMDLGSFSIELKSVE
jgi:hypothetical protein